MTLTELIERVERATGPDRELDAEIYAAVHPHMQPIVGRPGCFYDPSKIGALAAQKYITAHTRVAPQYTASLDAAMTLVPEGWCFLIDSNAPLCTVYRPTLAHSSSTRAHASASTPALALTAAALRARMGDEK